MSEATTIPNELLTYERKRRNWTQRDLADQIDGLWQQGENERTKAIRRWEDGVSINPKASYRRQLVSIFGRTLTQLGFSRKGRICFESLPPPNSCFIGREDILAELQMNLTQTEPKVGLLPQVLTGAEGIGKTEIALKFAHLHKFNYHTVVWLRAQSTEMLNADFAAIATLIDLPEARNETDEQKVIKLVKEWLENEDITRWLLIFDGVENEDILRNIYRYVPSPCYGHVIITTQLHSPNRETHEIEIKKGLRPEEAAHLLLKCAKFTTSSVSASEDDYRLAKEISQMLEGFPRDIDELGTQIKVTGSSLAEVHQKILREVRLHPEKRNTHKLLVAGDGEEKGKKHINRLTKRNQGSEQLEVFMESPDDRDEINREVEQLYLKRVIQDTYLIGLTGIPGLISQRVPLEQVFIPLRFHPNRPRVDYPLNDEEINTYREDQRKGVSNEDLERMLFEAEKNWVDPRNRDTISLSVLWQSLTPQVPAVVIQGYPGMGKSTLMARLALYMARKNLAQDDSTMDEALTPSRIPILLKLGEYARARKSHPSLSILDYLKFTVNEWNIQGVDAFVEQCLQHGLCLVMLDGLDEVSIDDTNLREQIQEEIKRFVWNLPGNYFLITSRVAGYDQAAFPDYTHFLIANLTLDQIEGFLPRWCRAHVIKMRALTPEEQLIQAESINAEAALMEQGLGEAIKSYPAVRRLAENPLLLTLLAVMHQNSIQLPERRVELYDTVTRTLLEHRNQTRNLPWIPEEQALAYLGPLAYRMQAEKNSFATQDEVITQLAKAVSEFQGGTPEEVESEVKRFLKRLRERGGIFVLRAGDYFGFFHRTFQEYFAARHILNKIDSDRDREIPQLISQVRRSDDLWREPFLLAVAYETGENKTLAQQIIRSLLDSAQEDDFHSQIHALLLAADCVIEAKPFTMEPVLLRRIARSLLEFYEQAQRIREFDVCARIEDAVHRWLSILPPHTYRAALLVILEQTISDTQHPALQRSTLTLLTMIAQEMDDCNSFVFETLIPLLLALAGLPAIGELKPARGLATEDPAISDLALTALCFMGKQGPSGLLLTYIREYFQFHPDQLRLLARYSLESATLLTPVVIPLSREKRQRYENAIKQWIPMRDQTRNHAITESEIEKCLRIHQSLLDCAEEVCYPSGRYFLDMLQDSVCLSDQPWQQVWQNYLLEQLATNDSIKYQEIVLLWITLFPEPEMQDVIAQKVLRDYEKRDPSAQHFIALLSNDLTEPRELRDLRELKYLRYLRDINYVTYLKFLRNMPHIRHLQHLSYLKNLSSVQYMKYLSLMRYQRYLRYWLFTEQVAKIALQRLSAPITTKDRDLLAILFGRIRQIQESSRKSDPHKRELQEIEKSIETRLVSTDDDEMREVMRDILRYFPVLR